MRIFAVEEVEASNERSGVLANDLHNNNSHDTNAEDESSKKSQEELRAELLGLLEKHYPGDKVKVTHSIWPSSFNMRMHNGQLIVLFNWEPSSII